MPLYIEETSTLQTLPRVLSKLGRSQSTKKVIKSLFAEIIGQKGLHFFENIWAKSGINLSSFMAESDVSSFLTENVSFV